MNNKWSRNLEIVAIASVSQGHLFKKDLDEESIAKLVSAMTLTTFQQGDVLFRKGDPMSDFFIVQSGQVLAKDIEWGGATYQDIVIGPKQHQNHFENILEWSGQNWS